MQVPGLDYAEEGRKLLERVNLGTGLAPERYANANVLYKHPTTGASLYVGNATAAKSLEILESLGVTRIVFCQDGDGQMHHAKNPLFRYLAFPIGRWRSLVKRQPESVYTFFKKLFDFVDEELGKGNTILIHCLAGAHRAGTAGISCLMHLCGMEKGEAIEAAQKLRPAINPIGDFPTLLGYLEEGMKR